MLCFIFSCPFFFPLLEDEVMEQRSGSSTPQRSCSAAGLHRPRLSIDAAAATECQSLMGSLSGSFVGSIPSVPPRLGSHTMDFFEMCASLIMALARWARHRSPSTRYRTVRIGSDVAVPSFFFFLRPPHRSIACDTEPIPFLKDPKCTPLYSQRIQSPLTRHWGNQE